MHNSLTDIRGVMVGHDTLATEFTGCTVVLCGEGAVGGVSVQGAAPGTRETDLLKPGNLVEEVHAVLLSGGSAFGLDAAAGVMRYLEERGIGFQTPFARVPIVPAAILYDLGVARVRPGPEEGYRACVAASAGAVEQGSVGAGTGATVGKVLGLSRATKGGLGSASLRVGGFCVGALVAVNALGDVVDPDTGRTIAGPRAEGGRGFLNTVDLLLSGLSPKVPAGTNTTIGVVATDARLTKAQAQRLAQMAQDGIALAVRPAHTMGDGDVIFALATGRTEGEANLTALGAAAARVVAKAIVNAVNKAQSVGGIPACREVVPG